MYKFFMPMKPPTATHQMKKTKVVKGKVIYYEPATVKEARAKLGANLARHTKGIPMHGPLRCVVKWLYPTALRGRDGTYKQTRPDIDNMCKLLFDVMTELEFWVDDSQIASLVVEKFYSVNPGIYIEIEKLEE